MMGLPLIFSNSGWDLHVCAVYLNECIFEWHSTCIQHVGGVQQYVLSSQVYVWYKTIIC